MKTLVLTLSKKDFVVQYFRAGGKGGQHQNKTSSGCRIIHPASGARGEARDSRSQSQNRKNAFIRLTESVKFKLWLNAQLLDAAPVAEVDLPPIPDSDLKVEVYRHGRWEVQGSD